MKNNYSRNFIIGVAFLISLALFYFGVNFLKGVNVLKKQNTYVVLFEDVAGLYNSSPIYVNGFQVGLVSGMSMYSTNPIKFAVNINLEGDYRIPKGSIIEFSSDLLGSSAANIIVEKNSNEYYVPGDTLIGRGEADMMQSVSRLLPRADSLLVHLDSVVLGVDKLMNSPLWAESLSGIGATVKELNESSKGLTKLMVSLNKDVPGITNNVYEISNDLKDITSNLNSFDIEKLLNSVDVAISNIEELSAKINNDDSSLGKLINENHLHDSLTNTLSSVSSLLDDIRANPQKYLSVKVKLF